MRISSVRQGRLEDCEIETLKSQLDALRQKRREILAWNAAYEDTLAHLKRTGFLQHSLKEGELFPDFLLPSAEGSLVSLESVLARGPAIISFFRGEWCPFCTLMLDALAATQPEIDAAGATLLALTPETGGLARIMKERHKARFEVLSDVDCGVGLNVGVVFRLPKLYRARLEGAGLSLQQRHGNGGWFLPVPATFIVGQDGIVAWRFADVDFINRAEPTDILAALRQLQRQG